MRHARLAALAVLSSTLVPAAIAQGIIILDARDPKGPIVFDQPLVEGDAYIMGKSIEELVKTTPIAPPIAELPPDYWMNQPCANCHQWDRAALCTQGEFYTTPAGASNLDKPHPFGGFFKRSLKVWAQGGCK